MEQGAQEEKDFNGSDVGKVKVNVQSETPAHRRDSDGRNGRNAVVPVAMPEQGSLPPWCPRLANIWDEHEAAFIQKGQMGAKFAHLFLYAATCTSSSVRSRLRFVRLLSVPASGNSTPDRLATTSIHARDGNERRSVSGSLPRFASTSTHPWSIPPPTARAGATSPTSFSPACVVGAVGREQASTVDLACLCADRPATSGPPNSGTLQPAARRREILRRDVVNVQPAADGLPTRQNFLLVSYPNGTYLSTHLHATAAEAGRPPKKRRSFKHWRAVGLDRRELK